jgi:hypothetical protein
VEPVFGRSLLGTDIKPVRNFSYHLNKTMPNAWIAAVRSTFAAGRKKNKSYSYKQAMIDAKKTYKKGSAAAAPKKKRGRKKKAQS